ncbi:MAG TPA: Clp protease N-terminal domain-containing protein [Planctomycetota bacterium]|nr:Clp protease N-terminal domain-containing protein [Planctomycetota bacterium]
MFHRFNERAREAIERAARKAKELRHAVVEPEHILASLAEAQQGDTSFHSLLKNFDVPAEAIADSLEAVPGPANAQLPKEPVFSAEAKRVLEYAVDEADKLGHKRIGTSHFLLAFIRDELEGDRGAQTLTSLGLTLEDARARVRELAEGEAAGRQDVVPAILFFELDRRARDAEQALRTRVEELEAEVADLCATVGELARRASLPFPKPKNPKSRSEA